MPTPGTIKKIINRIGLFLKTKSKVLLFVFIFLLTGLFFPFPAKAGILSAISGALLSIPAALIGLTFSVVALIISALSGLAAIFLDWVTTGINISYTKNEVVLAGLSVTQSLANMFLVLILAYIGIATMLRLAGYETKKLLRDFIIIALLVNFAPLICGVAIDAANIIINYFLSALEGGAYNTILNQLNTLLKELGTMWKNIFSFDPSTQIAGMTQAVMITILNIVLFFILMAFALVFLARMMILWILIILAPLAFVFRILPFPLTKGYYDKWLQNFIEWTTLGIFLSFFLYLANVVTNISFTGPGGESGNILALFVPIVFYAIALQMGLSVGGIGSKMVGYGKKYGLKGAKYGGKRLWAGTGGKFLASKTGRRFSSYLAQSNWGADTLKTKGKAGKVVGGIWQVVSSPGRWMTRGLGQAMLKGGVAQSKAVEDAKKKVEGFDEDRLAASYGSPTDSWADKLAKALKLAEKGGSKAFEKLTKAQQEEAIKLAAAYHPEGLKSLIKINPSLLKGEYKEEIKKSLNMTYEDDVKDENGKIIKSKGSIMTDEDAMEKIIKSMDSNDYNKISPENLKNATIVGMLIKNARTGKSIESLIEGVGVAAIEGIEKGIEELTKDLNNQLPAGQKKFTRSETLKELNPRIHQYIFRGGGRGLFNIPLERKKEQKEAEFEEGGGI